jgi:hypothetical protein
MANGATYSEKEPNGPPEESKPGKPWRCSDHCCGDCREPIAAGFPKLSDRPRTQRPLFRNITVPAHTDQRAPSRRSRNQVTTCSPLSDDRQRGSEQCSGSHMRELVLRLEFQPYHRTSSAQGSCLKANQLSPLNASATPAAKA